MKCTIVIAIFVCVPVLGLAQATWYVPDDFTTIQEALSDTSVLNGDTIIVRPGTYVENIDFLGKALLLKSEQGPNVTVIDGNHNRSVVTFNNGEMNVSVLEGFTITNGFTRSFGGGIFCGPYTSPEVKKNIITQNLAYSGGSGIYCGLNASPIIIDNIINENQTGSSRMGSGGGFYCDMDSSALIRNNTISNNDGAGVYCRSASPWVDQNTIEGNGSSMGGGGIACDGNSSIPIITNNIISMNSAVHGGGISCCGNSSPEIINNIIFKNCTGKHGGGIYSSGGDLTIIINNTIFGNTANKGGGVYHVGTSECLILNTILWNNEALEEGSEIMLTAFYLPCVLSIDYSDVKGGMASVFIEPGCTLNWGSRMINEDPQFVDPDNDDFHLQWTSPCINRGTNDVASSEDIDGDPKPFMGTVDMGADEFVGIHPLAADLFTVSEVTGGTVNFTLTGDLDNNGRGYIVLGGVTGTAPGTPLPGGLETLRLNWDVFTDFVVSLINTPIFMDFLGTLDATGAATAQLNAPPVPGFAGITMHYAYALNNPWDFVSNPVAVEIVP